MKLISVDFKGSLSMAVGFWLAGLAENSSCQGGGGGGGGRGASGAPALNYNYHVYRAAPRRGRTGFGSESSVAIFTERLLNPVSSFWSSWRVNKFLL